MCMGLFLKLLLLSFVVFDFCVSLFELLWFIVLFIIVKESFCCNNYMVFIVWLLFEVFFFGVFVIIGG